MSDILYKKKESFSEAGSINEFLDILLKKEINYFDRTNTLDLGNDFINYYNDPSNIILSDDLNQYDLIIDRIDELFNNLGNKKLIIIFSNKIMALYVLYEINKRSEVINLINENRIEIINKDNIKFCDEFYDKIQIPVVEYNGKCFNDENCLYLVFSKCSNLTDYYLLPEERTTEFLDLNNFKSKYNNDERFDIIQPIIDKCPIEVNNTYIYLWWLNLCVAKNYEESLFFYNIDNKIIFSTIFSFFEDDRFIQSSFNILKNKNILNIIDLNQTRLKMNEIFPDINYFKQWPFNGERWWLGLDQKTIYLDGNVE